MGKEKLYKLIKSQIITEQTAQLSEKYKQVVFKVDLSANKKEIKNAVETLFKVDVIIGDFINVYNFSLPINPPLYLFQSFACNSHLLRF